MSRRGDQTKTRKKAIMLLLLLPLPYNAQIARLSVLPATFWFFISHFSLQLKALEYFASIPYSVPLQFKYLGKKSGI